MVHTVQSPTPPRIVIKTNSQLLVEAFDRFKNNKDIFFMVGNLNHAVKSIEKLDENFVKIISSQREFIVHYTNVLLQLTNKTKTKGSLRRR